MRDNLGLLDGLLVSEAVMLALARHIGRQRAHEVVYELCMDAVEKRVPLRRVLLEDRRVNQYLGEADLDTLLDPARYTGLAARFVDRVAAR
jgi:adenylosuccinate lyase